MKYLLVFILSIGILNAQNTMDQEIEAAMQKYKAVGLSVAVVKNDNLVYQKAFGKKSIEKNENLSSSDMFRIASISKSFSSTSIMQLIEAGKLSLNDDISDLIGFVVRNPKFPNIPITVKMLLSHTSSLNDSEGYFTIDPPNPAKNINYKKCYNDYSPGTLYEYCNLNFNILGTVIEKLSGERFDQYVNNHILKPLGLYGGYCVDSLDQSRFATLYSWNATKNEFEASTSAYNPRTEEIKNYVFGYSTPIFSPTGGMKISAPDLAKYMIMHMNYGKSNNTRIISKKHSKIIQTPVNQEAQYGLALERNDKLIIGEKLVGHTGSAYGLYSSMFFNPKKKFGIVAITNGCTNCTTETFSNKLLGEVSNILYKNLID